MILFQIFHPNSVLLMLGVSSLIYLGTNVGSIFYKLMRSPSSWSDLTGYISFYDSSNSSIYKSRRNYKKFIANVKGDDYYYPLNYFKILSFFFEEKAYLYSAFVTNPLIALFSSIIISILPLILGFHLKYGIVLVLSIIFFTAGQIISKNPSEALSARIAIPLFISANLFFMSISSVSYHYSLMSIFSYVAQSVLLILSVYTSQFSFQCSIIITISSCIFLSSFNTIPIVVFLITVLLFDDLREKLYIQLIMSFKLSKRTKLSNPFAVDLKRLMQSIGLFPLRNSYKISQVSSNSRDLKFSAVNSINLFVIAVASLTLYMQQQTPDLYLLSPILKTLFCSAIGGSFITSLFGFRGFGPPHRYIESFAPYIFAFFLITTVGWPNQSGIIFLSSSTLLILLLFQQLQLVVANLIDIESLSSANISEITTLSDRLGTAKNLKIFINSYVINLPQDIADSKISVYPLSSDYGDTVFAQLTKVDSVRVWSPLAASADGNYIALMDDTIQEYGAKAVLDLSKINLKKWDLLVADKFTVDFLAKLIARNKIKIIYKKSGLYIAKCIRN